MVKLLKLLEEFDKDSQKSKGIPHFSRIFYFYGLSKSMFTNKKDDIN